MGGWWDPSQKQTLRVASQTRARLETRHWDWVGAPGVCWGDPGSQGFFLSVLLCFLRPCPLPSKPFFPSLLVAVVTLLVPTGGPPAGRPGVSEGSGVRDPCPL